MTDNELETELRPIVLALGELMDTLEKNERLIDWTYLDTAIFAIQPCLDPGGELMKQLTAAGQSRIR